MTESVSGNCPHCHAVFTIPRRSSRSRPMDCPTCRTECGIAVGATSSKIAVSVCGVLCIATIALALAFPIQVAKIANASDFTSAAPDGELVDADDEALDQGDDPISAEVDAGPPDPEVIHYALELLLKTEADSTARFDILSQFLNMEVAGFRFLVDLLVDSNADARMRDAAAQVLACDHWIDEWQDPKRLVRVKSLLLDSSQPLAIRARCAMILNSRNWKTSQINRTLIETIKSRDMEFRLQQDALSAVDRDESMLIPLLIRMALRCEESFSQDLSEEIQLQRVQCYAGVLKKINEAIPSRTFGNTISLLPEIVPDIQAGSPQIKRVVIPLLQKLGTKSPDAVEILQQWIGHDSADVREDAIAALGRLGKTSAVSVIRSALKDEYPTVRHAAVQALGQIGPAAASAIPDLFEIATGDVTPLNQSAAKSLAAIAPHDKVLLATWVRLLNDPKKRLASLEALRVVGNDAIVALPVLQKLLDEPDSATVIATLDVLAELGHAASPALPIMVQRLQSRNSDVRHHAIDAIGALGETSAIAVPAIAGLLAHSSEEMQSRAIAALVKIGSPAQTAVPELEALGNSPTRLRRQARLALGRISTNQDHVEGALVELLKDNQQWSAAFDKLPDNPALILAAAAHIAENADESTVDRLWSFLFHLRTSKRRREFHRILDDSTLPRQTFAAVALEKLPEHVNPPEMLRELIPWMKRPSARRAASRLVLRLGRHNVSDFAEMLISESLPNKLRFELVDGVLMDARFYWKSLVPLVRHKLKSDSAFTRNTAALVIGRLFPSEPDLLPRIVECLSHEDPIVCRQAAIVLKSIARNDVDVSMATPRLMTMIVDAPVGMYKATDERRQMFEAAVDAMLVIGARTEDVQNLRRMLDAANEKIAATDVFFEDQGPARYADLVIKLLATLGPQSHEALPAIRQFYLRLPFNPDTLELFGEPGIQIGIDRALQTDIEWESRQHAIERLGSMADNRKVVAVLQKLLNDEDQRVRSRAALALIQRPVKRHFDIALPILQETLRGSDTNLKYEAISRINNVGSWATAAIPELIDIVNQADSDQSSGQGAANALLEFIPENAGVQTAILDYIRSHPEDFDGLGMDRNEAMIPLLIRILEAEPDPPRRESAEILGDYEGRAMAAVPALRALMKSDQGDTGDAAAIALARIAPGSLDCVPRVFAAFESRGNRNAERALVRLGPNAAEIMPRLMEMLHDQDRAWDAIRVIGAIGPAARPAVPWLMQALHDEALGHAARSVLSELGETASEAGPDLIDALRHHHDAFWHRPVSPNVGPYVVEAIRLLCVDLENEESRLEAVERLTAFGSSAVPATQRLRDFTRSTDPDLRMASMEALAAIGLQAETSVPCLAAALSDPDPRIVRTALNSLRNFRHDASIALPQILKVLEQNKISTRDEMTHLLTVMGASAGDAIPILKRQLESSDPRVRIPAATAVHSIQMAAPPVRRRRVW